MLAVLSMGWGRESWNQRGFKEDAQSPTRGVAIIPVYQAIYLSKSVKLICVRLPHQIAAPEGRVGDCAAAYGLYPALLKPLPNFRWDDNGAHIAWRAYKPDFVHPGP